MKEKVTDISVKSFYESGCFLLNETRELLYIFCLLKKKIYQVDSVGLFKFLKFKIEKLTDSLIKNKFSSQFADNVRYFICASLDEACGLLFKEQAITQTKRLINEFYMESTSGEGFFELIRKLKKDVMANLLLLQLANYILSLGFRGKFLLVEDKELIEIKSHLSSLCGKKIDVFDSNFEEKDFSVETRQKKMMKFFYEKGYLLSLIFPIIFYLLFYFFLLEEKKDLVKTIMKNIT